METIKTLNCNRHPYQITLYRISEELGEAHQRGTSDEEANSPGRYDCYDTTASKQISGYLIFKQLGILGNSNVQALHHAKRQKDHLESGSLGGGGKTNAMH